MPADLSNPADVVSELFDADESVRQDFQNAVAAAALAFAESFAPAFKFFLQFEKESCGGVQQALVSGFMHGVLDDCLTSVKLLLSGKLSASGNLARQAVEGICMAMLAAHAGPVLLRDQECLYWELVVAEDERTQGHRALHQVRANEKRLGLSPGAADQLRKNIESHHAHSHAGRFAMASRMDLGAEGKIYFGGHFDPHKLEGYQAELQQRRALCIWALEVMEVLLPAVQKLPKQTT